MATYLRQSGQVSLLLSEAEANALRGMAELGEQHSNVSSGPVKAAADRAINALAASTNRAARRAGYFE